MAGLRPFGYPALSPPDGADRLACGHVPAERGPLSMASVKAGVNCKPDARCADSVACRMKTPRRFPARMPRADDMVPGPKGLAPGSRKVWLTETVTRMLANWERPSQVFDARSCAGE